MADSSGIMIHMKQSNRLALVKYLREEIEQYKDSWDKSKDEADLRPTDLVRKQKYELLVELHRNMVGTLSYKRSREYTAWLTKRRLQGPNNRLHRKFARVIVYLRKHKRSNTMGYINYFTEAELPVEDGDIVLDDKIVGWHEEVWDAKTNGWPEKGHYSNTPVFGVGNSFYHTLADWQADVLMAVRHYCETTDELDPTDTCLFWCWDEATQLWHIIEVGPQQPAKVA